MIFGIRHHGPGSARSLRAALEQLHPDAILVEGPPDAAEVLPLLAHPDMRPPVALLVYAPDAPRRAVYYPFALFSPEWQALHFGLTNGIPVRFMDLPQAYQLADRDQGIGDRDTSRVDEIVEDIALPPPIPHPPSPRIDPLGWLAAAAGYSDG